MNRSGVGIHDRLIRRTLGGVAKRSLTGKMEDLVNLRKLTDTPVSDDGLRAFLSKLDKDIADHSGFAQLFVRAGEDGNGTLLDTSTIDVPARLGNVAPAISVEGYQQGTFQKIMATMARLQAAGGRSYFHILNDGRIEPCVFAHFGVHNIRNTSILDAVNLISSAASGGNSRTTSLPTSCAHA